MRKISGVAGFTNLERMDRLLELAIPFFGPIVIGFLAGRLRKPTAEGLTWLNFFVIYVALPPVFYQVISKTPFKELTNFAYIGSTLLGSYLAYSLTFLIAYVVLHGRTKEAAVAGGIGGYGNVGYMGPGLAIAVLGQKAAAPMALVFCFDCILFFTVIPLLVATNEEHADLRQTLRLIVRRVALNPFILATFIGVIGAYFQIKLPGAVDRTLDFLKAASAPAALFALGVTVAMRPAARIPAETIAALVVKLLIHPVMVLLILSFVGPFEKVWMQTAVLMAALPPALSVFVMATQFSTYVERSSSAVFYGTVASIPTLLGWLWLIENNKIPLNLFGH